MKKIVYYIAFLSIIATFTHFEYLDSLIVGNVVETPNIDVPYLMSDRDLQELHTQRIKEELHLKNLSPLK